MESNKLVKGALVLTLAGIISKMLSAGYRIPLQNLTGDIGFYVYQQIYPILGIVLVLALYGFPAAISKLTAEKENISIKYFLAPIFSILFIICFAFAIMLYVFADDIARFVGDEHLTQAYQIAAGLLLVIPFTALLRGMFQGKTDMKPTAFSQIGEQLLRVVVIIAIAYGVATYGFDVYWIGNFAGIAAITGSFVAFIILVAYFVKNKPTIKIQQPIPWLYYAKIILVFGLVASLNHMILLIIQFADAFTVVPGLMDFGLSPYEAMEAKGIFDRGQPLIQVGAVLGSSFGLALLPNIAKVSVGTYSSEISEHLNSALKLSFYLAWGACIGLIVLFPEVNRLLYQDNQGEVALRILMIAVLLSAMVITATSILQGLGHIKWTAIFILGAFALKWLLNILLVPSFGIIGSAIGTVLSLFCLTVITVVKLKKHTDKKLHIHWGAFSLATLGMIGFLMVVDVILPTESLSRLALLFTVLFLSTVGAGIYLYLLIRLQAFTHNELKLIPFGKRFSGRK
ncbi:putative polysaccharide biosynthesis protein [Ornithinibacillus californiensis]|uniref:putative polysaccharide biosynthesis protein n=1 Tax=Ornithinibacillus californiensis TaxID=161536 RepID=UPI00064D7B19|nr:polysaccharide biosynthesis protein [Ornithinibacillus californiensis]